jgi:hypothetical protein
MFLPGVAGASSAGAGASSGVAGGSAGRAGSTARLVVTPSKGLADGQIVTVTGSGFAPHKTVAMVECEASATGSLGCDINHFATATTDKHGRFSIPFQVIRHLLIGGLSLDCAKHDACILGAALYSNLSRGTARAFLGFDPNAKPIVPKISVAPSRHLAPNQTVTVTGSGFGPNQSPPVVQCLAGSLTGPGQANCQFIENEIPTLTSSTGTFSIGYQVSSHILLYTRTGLTRRSCEVAPGCVLEVATATAPVSLDPSKRPILPTMSLSRRGGLADGEIVTVSGAGFAPDSAVTALECPPNPVKTCGLYDESQSFANAAGVASVQIAVDENLSAGLGRKNCAAAATRCGLYLYSASDPWFGSHETIAFDSSLAPVRPRLAVSPSSGLSSGAVVTAVGHGFPAGASVEVYECLVGAPLTCSYGSELTADASGGFSEGLIVQAVLASGQSCTATGAKCEVVAENVNNTDDMTRYRISF